MLELKIIEPGESDFTSPLILVEAQGKEARPCIDYRRYASFVTTFGTFKPLRLPFGLKNAPYYLLRNCEDFAVPYLDDIAIFSPAWDDHLKHLKDVFDRLRSAKLHIKPSKCQFAQAYVKYLEHLVGQVIAAPLTDLLKGRNRKSTVDWNSSCQNAFEELKTRLSKNPVFYSPDFTKPFIIQCDASNLGIGVVLSQSLDFGASETGHTIIWTTVDEIVSDAADYRLTYTMANCHQRRKNGGIGQKGPVSRSMCPTPAGQKRKKEGRKEKIEKTRADRFRKAKKEDLGALDRDADEES
ncbi:retrovirus-related Pol polyprotein from transposon 17.6 [Trichonephila clavipes]|nr:retrovirus-related Pol polyprotein from transposon 17.6 [Trichonephila clavipes]